MAQEEPASAPSPAPGSAAAAPAPAKKEKKKPPEGLVIPPKKPKLTKAERRALQEQQRAAKAAGGGGGGEKGGSQQQQQQQKGSGGGGGGGSKPGTPKEEGAKSSHGENKQSSATAASDDPSASGAVENQQQLNNRMSLVSHLKVYPRAKNSFFTGATLQPKYLNSMQAFSDHHQHHHHALHPAVISLGYQYAKGQVRGGNDRCRAMLSCFKTVLLDYIPPSSNVVGDNSHQKLDLRQTIDQQVLKPSFQFWTEHCRHHSVSMGNAFSFLKTAVSSLERELEFDEMRTVLLETMQAFSNERIDYAGKAIADLACTKLLLLPPPATTSPSPSLSSSQHQQTQQTSTSRSSVLSRHSEVILTYGYSEVISVLLRQAAERCKNSNKTFRVIVVDSRPHLQGRRMLEELRQADIDCTYILLNALTYVLNPNQEFGRNNGGVTKVLLGAAALMSDGSVLGSIGTACVALCAHDRHVPVLVCCETYKISNRVQLESLTHNELSSFGDMDDNDNDDGEHKHDTPTKPTSQQRHHHHLNLSYDLTPAPFVSGIVTELGIVPPTSVAVLLREMNPQGN